MADQTINIGLNVSSNGTTDAEIKKASQLNSVLKDAQRSAGSTKAVQTASAATSGGAGDSNFARGITGQTGAAGRDFAAQAQGLGGLVHVYATFAANIFAVSAAFTALSKAADFELMTKGLDQIGAASGRNLGTMAKRLVEITDGAVNLKTALTATAQANATGITADQLSRLAAVAATASHALGRDLNESLERLLLGVTKNQPKLLDELGIIVHVGKAASDYAQIMGKSVTSLTEFEKSQSFVIASIKQGEAKFKDVVIAANPYSKLLAEVTNTAYKAGAAFNTILGPIAKFLGENPTALAAVLAAFTTMLLSKAIPALTQWREELGKTALRAAESAKMAKASFDEFMVNKDLGPGRALQAQAEVHKAAAKQILDQNKDLFSETSKIAYKTQATGANANYNADDVRSAARKITQINREIKQSEEDITSAKTAGNTKAQEVFEKENARAKARLDAAIAYKAEVVSGAFAAQQGKKADDSAEINANAKSPWWSKEAQLARNQASTQIAATKAQIISTASEINNSLGFSEGFKSLRENIKNSNLDGFQSKLLTVTGTIKLGMSSIMSLAGSLSNVFMIVGIGVAVLGVLDSVFSKNAKAVTNFKSSVTSLNDAVDGTQRTLDFYAHKAEKAFSSEGIVAYANTFNELVAAIQKVSSSLEKVKDISSRVFTDITKDNWWERLGDETASLIGGGIRKTANKAMAAAMEEAIKLVGNGPQKAKLDALFATLAPKTVDKNGLLDSLNAINPEQHARRFAELSKELDSISHAASNSGSAVTEYNNATKVAIDAQEKYIQSLANSDSLFKFGASLQLDSNKLSAALEDPLQALTMLLERAKSFEKLSILNPDTAISLSKATKDLQALQDRVVQLDSDLTKSRAAVETAKADIYKNNTTKNIDENTYKLAPTFPDVKVWVDATSAVRNKEKDFLDLKVQVEKETAKVAGKIVLEEWIKGSEVINNSLKRAEDSAGIALSKTAISGLSGSGTAQANAVLAKQELNVQLQLVKAQIDMLTSQEALRIEISNNTQQLIKDSKSSTAEEKEKASKILAQNNIEKNATAGNRSAASMNEELMKLKETSKPDDKTAQLAISVLTAQYHKTRALESRVAIIGMQIKGVDIQAEKDTSKENTAQQGRLLQFAAQELGIRMASLNVLKGYSPIFNELLAAQVEITQKSLDKNVIDQKSNELLEIRKQAGITDKNLSNQQVVAALAGKAYQEQYLNKLREIAIAQQQQAQAELARIHAVEQAKIDSLIFIREIEDKIAANKNTIQQAELDVQKNTLDALKNYGSIDEGIYAKEKAALERIIELNNFNVASRQLQSTQAAELLKLEEKIAAAKRSALEQGPMSPTALAADPTVVAAEAAKALAVSRQNSDTEASNATFAAKQKIADMNATIAAQTGQMNELLKTQAGIVDSLALSFGNFGTAVGGALTAFTEGLKRNSELTAGYSIQLQQIADQKKAELDKVDKGEDGNDNAAKQAEIAIKYAEKEKAAKVKFTKDTTDNEIASLAKGANALKKNFAEKTAAYKILDAIEKAASAERIVRQAMEFATNLPKYLAEMGLMGGQAVLNQGKGDPYSAIPRMAAMAALVATIMSAFGGNSKVSVSGASQKEIDAATAENVQKIQNTGGVLGDSGATSNSIKNGIEELSKNSFSDLDYTQEMLKSLKNIDKGISAFGAAVARSTGIQGTGPSKFGVVDGSSSTSASKGFLGLFGKSTTVTTDILDTGVRLTGSIGDFLKGIGKIIQYEKDLITTTTTKSGFLGIGGGTSTNKEIKEQTSVLEDTTQKLVSNIIKGMTVSISDAFKLLQLPTENLIDLLSGVDVTGLAASLKGLTGQAASDAIDAFFSNIFDKMSDTVAPWLGEFQKVGESLGDTLVRVASNTRTVDYAYISLGASTIDAATAAKEANVSIEEWVISQLRATEALIDMAGGLDDFVSKMDYITQNFLSETQKLAPVRKALTEAFSATGSLGKELSKVGLATPKTRAEFVSLLTTLHDMGDAGNAATVALLDVAPAFNKIQGAIEDIISSVGQRISDLEFQMTLDTLDTQGKYALINKTAGEDYAKYMEAVNDKAVSTVDAAKLANKLIDRIQQGWNLLTTEQRQESGVKAKYFADLDEINASLTAKGGAELLGLSNDTISLIDNADSNTNRLIDAIKNSPTKLATESTKAVTKPLEKINESIVSGSKLSSFGDVQQTNLDKQQQTQDMKMIQSQTAAITMSEMLSRAMIAKAMESSAQQLYGMPTGVSTGDVDNLVNATLEAPTRFASAMAATPIVIPPVDVSGIEASVDDLKQTVANMLAILTQQAAEPVNLNVNVQAPRNQEVGVSLV